MVRGLFRLALYFGLAITIGFCALFLARHLVLADHDPFYTIIPIVAATAALCFAVGILTAAAEEIYSPCLSRATCFALGMMIPALVGLKWGGISWVPNAFVSILFSGSLMYWGQKMQIERRKRSEDKSLARSLTGFLNPS